MKLAENLKKAVLQAAMQGKLTRQLKTDSSVDDLLQKIAEEKAALIKEGKIKKDTTKAGASGRALAEITEEEIPFEIPENWRWCRLGEIGTFLRGSGIKRAETVSVGLPCIRYGELYTTYKTRFSKVKTFVPKSIYDKSFKIEKNDICMALTGENKFDIALASVYQGETPIAMGGDMTRFRLIYGTPLYFVYAINSTYGINCKQKLATGDIICHISNDKLANIPFPLPPIEEQQRIVEKLNSILPIIDEYGKEEDELVALGQNFPEDIKKSVLQSAMQGKLTQQLQTDSSVDDLLKKIAEEKETLIKEGKIKKDTTKAGASGRALAEITEEEIPFEIPENWRWCRLGEIVSDISDIDHKMPAVCENGIPYISPLNFLKDGSIDYAGAKKISKDDFLQLSRKCKPERGDLIFPRYGTIGIIRKVETDIDFLVSYSCATIKPHLKNVYSEYIYYVLLSPLIQQIEIPKYVNKTTQPNVGLQSIKKFLIPLPPIEEQQRIVEKLNQILPIIDSMAVYGTKKKAGRPKQEEALSFIRTFLQAKKQAQSKTAAPEILALKAKAKQELPAAVQKYAGLMGVTYNRITIRHQKTRWGSCTKTGNLNFNCLIMKMPDQVRDYVIIHELAHRKELNHSSKYWTIVAEYCPWYKQAKQWLKDNGQKLMER